MNVPRTMFDRIINILVIEDNTEQLSSLLSILQSPGHNVFVAKDSPETLNILVEKEFVLIFCSLDLLNIDPNTFLGLISRKNSAKNATIIVTSNIKERVYSSVGKSGKHGAMDYLMKPYISNLVIAKVEVYKKLYFKHKRVNHLLESILPMQTLKEFSLYGKSSPKKKKNSVVLFTDFVNFTQKTKNIDPQELVKKLDYYFSKFDAIILKYNLEKIKTIGDAYMAVGGVTETMPNANIRTALAAIEIRNFILTDIMTHKAMQRDYWEIRIGIHTGDLVAGVVGTHKFSFDVWGDTVNIAARCEQNSAPNQINISETFAKNIEDYFDLTSRGKIKIKNGGKIGMFFLNKIKSSFSLYKEGRIPNIDLRAVTGLPSADFQGLRSFILNKLKAELSDDLLYHSVAHTIHVEEAVIKYGELEKLNKNDLFLLKTAAIFHDSGYLFRYEKNEKLAVELLEFYAPKFGYSKSDIKTIENIILCTRYSAEPKNMVEAVMCDADLDYLGRLDYHITATKLFKEMEMYGKKMTEVEKIKMQIDYLENHHHYYTTSAINLRAPGKKRRIEELKVRLLDARTDC